MAIDMISEAPSLATSPRISFSNDLCHKDDDDDSAAIEEGFGYRTDPLILDPSSEFDFCISSSTETETSSADELFSHGLIRPLQIQERFVSSANLSISRNLQTFPSLPPLPIPSAKQENPKEMILPESEQKNNQQSKSFWRFKRSSSLHGDSGHKKSSFWSLPLLSRSNSTGSIPKPSSKDGQKQSFSSNSKQSKSFKTNPSSTSSSSSSTGIFYAYHSAQKPPLRRNYGGPYGNGVRISPVLNVPSPCIGKGSANLLGLGSLFRNGKEKKARK